MQRKESENLSPHRYIGYTLTPCWGDHNSLGYRGEEFSEQKPKGEKRIVVFGDSIIYQDNGALSIPAALNEIVPFRVINAGVGGYSSLEVMLLFLLRGLDLDPDMVVIHPCVDDVRSRLTTLYRGDGRGRRVANNYQVRSREWTFKNGYRSLLHAIGIRRHQIVSVASPHYRPKEYSLLDINPPVYFKRNIEAMVFVSKGLGIQVILCTLAFLPSGTDRDLAKGFLEHNHIMRNIAEERRVKLCDLEKFVKDPDWFRADGYHYNETGVRNVAGMLKTVVHE